MEQFTSSNGIVVRSSETGVYMDKVEAGIRLYPADVDALREFFQHERDEELGRWRWPEKPEWVVYSRRPGYAALNDADLLVINEAHGASMEYARALDVGDEYAGVDEPAANAARAYFEAHPERKAWEDAKPGDVWVLTLEGVDSAFYPSKSMGGYFTPVAHGTGRTLVAFDSFEIESARRIWPVSDD